METESNQALENYFADFSGEDYGTRQSFAEFADRRNKEGLGGVMDKFRKKSATPDEFGLELRPIAGSGDDKKIKGARFYSDGSYGLALTTQDSDPSGGLLLAGSTVAIGQQDLRLKSGTDKDFNLGKVPVVIQLQGVSRTMYEPDPRYAKYSPNQENQMVLARLKHRLSLEILRQYRWEPMLLTFMIEWATKMGYPELYVLPAKYNSYYSNLNATPELQKRLTMRYDVTSKRMGFMMRENGLYGITLS